MTTVRALCALVATVTAVAGCSEGSLFLPLDTTEGPLDGEFEAESVEFTLVTNPARRVELLDEGAALRIGFDRTTGTFDAEIIEADGDLITRTGRFRVLDPGSLVLDPNPFVFAGMTAFETGPRRFDFSVDGLGALELVRTPVSFDVTGDAILDDATMRLRFLPR